MIIEYTDPSSVTAETVTTATYTPETVNSSIIDDECFWKIQYNPLVLENVDGSGDQVPLVTENDEERITTEEGYEI